MALILAKPSGNIIISLFIFGTIKTSEVTPYSTSWLISKKATLSEHLANLFSIVAHQNDGEIIFYLCESFFDSSR